MKEQKELIETLKIDLNQYKNMKTNLIERNNIL